MIYIAYIAPFLPLLIKFDCASSIIGISVIFLVKRRLGHK